VNPSDNPLASTHQPESVAPRVFVSHARADKDRFARGFTERLRANGVNAWFDEWEIGPGDSLVDRIFDSGGLKDAAVVIVILSRHSIERPWVNEERRVAVVRRIEKLCRLIPVILDGVDVPTSLTDVAHVTIDDPLNYDAEFARILDSIFGVDRRPPLEPPPASVRPTVTIGDQSPTASRVLAMIAEDVIATGEIDVLEDRLIALRDEAALAEDSFDKALARLDHHGLIAFPPSQPALYIAITDDGLLAYLRAAPHWDFERLNNRVIAALVNDSRAEWTLHDLARTVEIPEFIVNLILHTLAGRELLGYSLFAGGESTIRHISPLLEDELT
jgi:hypothetical protein